MLRVVASLRALVHFSAKLSFSAQNTIASMAVWDNWNTRLGDIPSYSSKFFCKFSINDMDKV